MCVCICNDNPTTINPFDVSVCSVRICAGYQTPISWWIYKENSYQNNTSSLDEIDDDDYIVIQPLSLKLCETGDCSEISFSIDLQNENNLSSKSGLTSSNYNGDSASVVSYEYFAVDPENNEIQVTLNPILQFLCT